MATNDVPGSNSFNRDVLAMGSWAEHDDGSLLLVISTEGNRVIYELFDVSGNDAVCYRDAMPIGDFNKAFSWDSNKFVTDTNGRRIPKEKWLWHDKTPFPFDKVMDNNLLKQGIVPISAAQQISAAAKVAQSLKLRAEKLDTDNFRNKIMAGTSIVSSLKDKFARALDELRK